MQFESNKAKFGVALYIYNITFKENTAVKFENNEALLLEEPLHSDNSNIMFENNCTIAFNHNEALQGGAIFTQYNVVFKEDSTMHFENNKVTLEGALHISNIMFKENTVVRLEAILNGGALYCDSSDITIKQNSAIVFTNNQTENDGAVFTTVSILLVSDYSNVIFCKNAAKQDGGAIYCHNQIIVISNTANNHGGAIDSKIMLNTKHFDTSEIYLSSDNTTTVSGSSLYIDVPIIQ